MSDVFQGKETPADLTIPQNPNEYIAQLRAQLAQVTAERNEAKCGKALCGHDHSTQYWELRANKAEQQLAAVTAEREEWHARWLAAHKVKDANLNTLLAQLADRDATIAALQARVTELEAVIDLRNWMARKSVGND